MEASERGRNPRGGENEQARRDHRGLRPDSATPSLGWRRGLSGNGPGFRSQQGPTQRERGRAGGAGRGESHAGPAGARAASGACVQERRQACA